MTPEEFRTIIMETYPLMRRMALSMLKNKEDASDAIQDTSATLWLHIDSLENSLNRRAYILTALRNRCLSRLRSVRPTVDIDEAVTSAYSAEDSDKVETEDLLSKLLNQLPPTQQKVLNLSICLQLDNDTIATRTGLSKENVRQIISRGRRTLRQLYNRHLKA